MFDSNPVIVEMVSRCLVESRLESARHRSQRPSAIVVTVGQIAAAIRRSAGAVESWANGRVDSVVADASVRRAH